MRTFAEGRLKVDDHSIKYPFCPGKATWYAQIVEVFEQCRFAYHTGILPREGHFTDQDGLFAEVYPHFVSCWVERRYGRIWQDVNTVIPEVLKAIGKMFGSK